MRSFWTVVAGMVHVFLPFMILSIASTLGGIDPSLPEAAALLGASPAVSFRAVTLPLSVQGIASGSIIVFCLATSVFLTPLWLSWALSACSATSPGYSSPTSSSRRPTPSECCRAACRRSTWRERRPPFRSAPARRRSGVWSSCRWPCRSCWRPRCSASSRRSTSSRGRSSWPGQLDDHGFRTELILHDPYISLPGTARRPQGGRQCLEGSCPSRRVGGALARVTAGAQAATGRLTGSWTGMPPFLTGS